MSIFNLQNKSAMISIASGGIDGMLAGKPERESANKPRTLNSTIRNELNSFFETIEKKAFRYARNNLGDDQVALDLVQDSMLGFARSYATKPDTEWMPLFYTILNNRIRDHFRRQSVRNRYGPLLSLFQRDGDNETRELQEKITTESHSGGLSTPEAELHQHHLRSRIASAVARLPVKQREVFLLREIEQLSVAETASVVGCSEGSVKQHHFRAVRRLRDLLAPEWQYE